MIRPLPGYTPQIDPAEYGRFVSAIGRRYSGVNEGLPRGLRWEYFMTFNSFGSCLNLQNVVFGEGDDYDAWVAKARSTLVRYPSEADVFELFKAGLLGTKGHPMTRCVPNGRVLKLIRTIR